MYFNRFAFTALQGTPTAPDCSSGTKISRGRSDSQPKWVFVGPISGPKSGPRFSGSAGKSKVALAVTASLLMDFHLYFRTQLQLRVQLQPQVTVIPYNSLQLLFSPQLQLEFQIQLKTKNSWGRSHLPPHGRGGDMLG